jgi:hypothetical protein|tara:strand:+ start:212 stop:808 length:597 start_codon:yes stop_codon:yes gene_type:complete
MTFTGKESAAYFADGEPKFPFGGRIIEAYYTSPKLDNILIIYNYEVPDDDVHTAADGVTPNGGEMVATEYNISVQEGGDMLAALLEEFSYEAIDECTRNRNENQRQEFRDAFHRYATQNNMYGHGLDAGQNQDESQGSLNIIFDFDSENTEHKEVLFKMKLKMFEQDVVKNSKKRKAKTEIRKAETPLEAIKAYASFF